MVSATDTTPGVAAVRASEIAEELALLDRASIPRTRQREIDGEHAARRVAEIDRLQCQQAARHEPGAERQHHRQGDLTDDERAPQPRMAGAHERAGALLHRGREVDAANLKRGSNPEEQPGGDGRHQGKRQHRGVDGDAIEQQDVAGNEAGNRLGDPVGNGDADDRAAEREQQAFGEQLSRDAETRAAEREANADLLLPRETSRQQQAGDVAAADQQQAEDGAEEKHQRPASGAREVALQRHHARVVAEIERGELRSEIARHALPCRSAPPRAISPASSARRPRGSGGRGTSGSARRSAPRSPRGHRGPTVGKLNASGITPTTSNGRSSSMHRAPDDGRRHR